jgi:hypothetical protein
MSGKFAIVPIAVWGDRRLTGPDCRVLGALYSFRGADDREVWPSRAAIAERAGGMHPSTVSRITARLVRLGWIEIRQTRGSNRYILREAPVIRPPEAPQPSPPGARVSTTPRPPEPSPRYRGRGYPRRPDHPSPALATGGEGIHDAQTTRAQPSLPGARVSPCRDGPARQTLAS